MTVTILKGDCRDVLRSLPAESVHCVVTSPPYWGLRDYGVPGQIGLETNFRDYIDTLAELFRQMWRVVRNDGTVWLNLGDSYAGGNGIGRNDAGRNFTGGGGNIPGSGNPGRQGSHPRVSGLKPKDLCGIPWRVALTLQADGWYLRQDIIWSKPNPMPESVRDRCTKAHEYLFLLSKSERYYYDADAIREEFAESTLADRREFYSNEAGWSGNPNVKGEKGHPLPANPAGRNRRSVWEIATTPFPGAHFATFPTALIEPCILAGSSNETCRTCGAAWRMLPAEAAFVLDGVEVKPMRPARSWCGHDAPGGPPSTILDPFGGAGTTAMVADRQGRNSILIEINPEYAAMAERRFKADAGMFAEVQ